MLKGVRKNVVEVVDMENEYFERAILFVKPGKEERDLAVLRHKGKEYINTIAYRPRRPEKRLRILFDALKLTVAACVGAGIMFLVHFWH